MLNKTTFVALFCATKTFSFSRLTFCLEKVKNNVAQRLGQLPGHGGHDLERWQLVPFVTLQRFLQSIF